MTIDIDGTLTDDSKILSTRGIEALRQVQNRGITVCLISGNVLPITYALHTYIGLKGPFISENGGVIYHDGEVIKLFDITLPKKALEVLKRDMGLQEPFTSQWRLTEVAVDRRADISRIKEILRGWKLVIEPTGFAIHVMNIGHGKGTGVKKVAELLGISADEIIAFGDSDNDVSMFQYCSTSVAVGNASPSAKAAATYVSKEEHANGVIDGFNHFGLL